MEQNTAYLDKQVQHIACADCFQEQYRPNIIGLISAECEFCGNGPSIATPSPFIGNPLHEPPFTSR